MNDLERRLRDTYSAVLESIEGTDRLSEIDAPATSQDRARGWRFSPAFAFGAAALVTILVVGGFAFLRPGGDTTITLESAEELFIRADGQVLSEIRFDDASIVATGGINGRPVVVAITDDGRTVLREMVGPREWEEQPIEPWKATEGLLGYGSDGEAFAVVLPRGTDGEWFRVHVTSNGTDWVSSGFAASTATQAYGSPAAGRITTIEDVSVDGGRVTVLVRTDPSPDAANLESFLENRGDLTGEQSIDAVLSWGPEGIEIRLADGATVRYELADLGIEPSWVYSGWEVWITQPDGSTRGIPIGGALVTPMEETTWQPITATSAGDSLYVGGSRDGEAVLEVSDLSTEVIEPFNELDLDELIEGAVEPLLAVTSLRTSDGVAVAGISAPNTAVVVKLDGTARAAWAIAGANTLAVTEMTVRGDLIASVGYPGVIMTQNDLQAAGVAIASVSDFGIADRHPTGITLTDRGVIALPQAGTDPSSFGSDGSAWIIDLLADSEPSR